MKGSLDDTEKEPDHVKLSLTRSESQVKRLSKKEKREGIAWNCMLLKGKSLSLVL